MLTDDRFNSRKSSTIHTVPFGVSTEETKGSSKGMTRRNQVRSFSATWREVSPDQLINTLISLFLLLAVSVARAALDDVLLLHEWTYIPQIAAIGVSRSA
jgi:hypothetical protein